MGDLLGGGQEFPQPGLLVHDAGIISGVGRGPHVLAEFGQKDRAPDFRQFALVPEHFGHGHQVHRPVIPVEPEHDLEDVAVGRPVKVLRLQDQGDLIQSRRPQQDRAQNTLLSLTAPGRRQVLVVHSVSPFPGFAPPGRLSQNP